MSWFGFGAKRKKSVEEEYKEKLDQLEKLGYKDRKTNLILLKLYAESVNDVIRHYVTLQQEKIMATARRKKQQPTKEQLKQEQPSPNSYV